jgi:hypothetical protein
VPGLAVVEMEIVMGAKDWMLLYAEDQVRPVLRSAPRLDREATRALVARLYPAHRIEEIDDGTLLDDANPPDRHVYAACLPGLSVVCTSLAALDRPSQLPPVFLDEAKGRTLYLHAMHSVVDWFAYAIWSADGSLRRSLSVSPDDGVIENLGDPLAFEAPYWAGERPVDDDTDDSSYPLPFHPLDMAEDALRHLFGFNYEGHDLDGDPDLEEVVLAGFVVHPDTATPRWRMSTGTGPDVPEPDPERIAGTLRQLASDRPTRACERRHATTFAILERADGRFVQVAAGPGTYAIEYQDGDVSRHYAARTNDITEVIRLFQGFARDDESWKVRHAWTRLEL